MVSMLNSFMPLAAAALAVAALGAAPPDTGPVTVAVPGRANANVSIAARGTLVVAAWGASRDGAADVYAAVSHDGGRSFGAPVRVNATAGEAALGGERAPRVAIAPRQGGPAIAVLWTAKAPPARAEAPAGSPKPGPVIRLAESIDLGRTFAAPIDLSGRNVPGDPRLGRARRRAPTVPGMRRGSTDVPRRRKRPRQVPRQQRRRRSAATGGHHHHGGSTGDGPLQEVFYRVVGGDAEASEALGASGVCFCCKTAILGPGAPATGRPGARDMVLAWRHIFPNSERDIAMSVLDAGAGRPGRMMRVSADRWQLQGCPDDGPGLAASGSGTIHVVWPTLAATGATGPEKAIYHARTTDGRTFTPRRRLDRPGSGAAHPVVAALASGEAVALWDEAAEGARRVVVQPIREPAEPHVLGPGTYPAAAALDDGFVVAWTMGSGDAAVVRVQRVAP